MKSMLSTMILAALLTCNISYAAASASGKSQNLEAPDTQTLGAPDTWIKMNQGAPWPSYDLETGQEGVLISLSSADGTIRTTFMPPYPGASGYAFDPKACALIALGLRRCDGAALALPLKVVESEKPTLYAPK